jgi:dihydroflavonol-4-reductase
MILVTGGTGMLGAHLIFDLLQIFPTVKATKRASSDLASVRKIFSYYTLDVDSMFDKIEWIDADLSDCFSIEDALKGIRYVYHCAAFVSLKKSDLERLIRINKSGTANLINACLQNKIEKLVHVSSIAALGSPSMGIITDEYNSWKHHKDSPYAISKYQSELEVWRGIAEGLNAVIVNPSFIIGPGDWTKGSPYMFPLIAGGMKFYTYATNGYVGVKDVCRAMILLMKAQISSERFIINAADLSYYELFSMIADSIGAPLPYIEVKAWMLRLVLPLVKAYSFLTGKSSQFNGSTAKTFVVSSCYSSKKIQKALNFTFTDIQKVIKETGSFYLIDQK